MIHSYDATSTRVNCNRTCSSTACDCNHCNDNPHRGKVEQYYSYEPIPISKEPESRKKSKSEKIRERQHWKNIQSKHSRRR